MGLDDLMDETNGENSSSSREYVDITFEEMKEFFSNRGEDWIIDKENPSKEVVFKKETNPEDVHKLQLKCYTTIDKRTGHAREKGADAMRLILWDPHSKKPVWGKRKTLRIKTWKCNLGEKIDEMLNELGDFINTCNECGKLMVLREGKYGEFFGCTGYPKCDNTKEPVDF